MKNIFLIGLAIIIFTACNEQKQRYTQQSPEIEIVKKAIDNYNNKKYDITIYADTSKTLFKSNLNSSEIYLTCFLYIYRPWTY